MAQKQEELGESGDEKPAETSRGFGNLSYLASLPGLFRILNIILACVIIGLWVPGYEHDYKNPSQIVNFRDFTKNYGAGYKSETLNQFALAAVILCLLLSLVLLVAIVVVAHAHIDWHRMNRMAHIGLSIFHCTGTVCAAVGLWNFQENCCRVDVEWNGLGFRYIPLGSTTAIQEFGYPRNNYHCTCWLTKRESRMENERSYAYSTVIWEPQNPEKYSGEENNFVSFSAHHIHIHMVALFLMILNTLVYLLASIFSKPHSANKN